MTFSRTAREANSSSLPEKSLQGRDRKSFQGRGAIKPLWDLYRDGLTQGSINLFLQCREQFRLTYWEGWSKLLPGDAIEFGSCFHDCLAHMDLGDDTPVAGIAKAMRHYDKKSPLMALSAADRQKALILRQQVAVMLEGYRKQWGKIDGDRSWVLREETFNVNYYPSMDYECPQCALKIPLRGRFDGIFRKSKSLWLHETKTKGRIDQEGIQMSLPFDTQTMLYMYAAERQLGERIAGVCYDVVKRPGQRQGKNESPQAFALRVAAEVAKHPKEYYMRWDMVLLKSDLQRWVDHQLEPILLEIAEWWDSIKLDPANPWKSPKHYMNAANLTNQYGRCSLFHLITKGQPFGLHKRKLCYPELQD